ncbi:MAG: metallophosphoesterase [Nanoarchaeota archaeon]
MKFAHLGDCHLGGWRQPELRALNFQYFQQAINYCLREKVEFILITGDLFDSAYPPIDSLKEAFNEFRKLKEAKIPVFLIAGSHDYSASGKTFLDVLETSGFCKNVSIFEEKNNIIYLQPTIYKNVAIYGYPGRKSGMEVQDIARMKLQDSPGLFKILMLHTAIRDAVGTLPIPAVEENMLPKIDYLALSHLHIFYTKENRAYSGPIFPNNISELEELQSGSFCIFNNGKIKREIIALKKVSAFNLEINDALNSTQQIISFLDQQDLLERIIILNLSGILEKGRISDVDFNKIENFARKKGAFSFLKSTTKLRHPDSEIVFEEAEANQLESLIIDQFTSKNQSKFNPSINNLLRTLQIEQMEEEKSAVFEERLYEEIKKVIEI